MFTEEDNAELDGINKENNAEGYMECREIERERLSYEHWITRLLYKKTHSTRSYKS